MSNSFGRIFQIHSFGESHGPALGVVIEGLPAGVPFDEGLLREDLKRRRPGASTLVANQVVSGRQEFDRPEILSGIFEGKTLGTPIAVMIRNEDARSGDYSEIKHSPRAGHADDLWREKFAHSDHRGGGRSSGRETVSRVIGGAFAKMYLKAVCPEFRISAYSRKIGKYELSPAEKLKVREMGAAEIDQCSARFPSPRHLEVQKYLKDLQAGGNSAGGVVEVRVFNSPRGLGEPVFAKVKNELASAMMSLGATSAFELGDGVLASSAEGIEFHDPESQQRQYGGIRGGITTGEEIVFRVHFKPTSSIQDVAKKGRHDPCIVPRAVPVCEAMTALVFADLFLQSKLNKV